MLIVEVTSIIRSYSHVYPIYDKYSTVLPTVNTRDTYTYFNVTCKDGRLRENRMLQVGTSVGVELELLLSLLSLCTAQSSELRPALPLSPQSPNANTMPMQCQCNAIMPMPFRRSSRLNAAHNRRILDWSPHLTIT